jgi:hypothetical protein
MNTFNNIAAALGAGNNPQNIGNQVGQVGMLGSMQGIGLDSAQAYRDKTPAEQIAEYRARVASRDKVLQYFEAQLNMDLFKEDTAATSIFIAAMSAAFEQAKKL